MAILLVLLIAMAFSAVYGWAIERAAYRPLRGSFRLAPLISAIGVSIALQNYDPSSCGAPALSRAGRWSQAVSTCSAPTASMCA